MAERLMTHPRYRSQAWRSVRRQVLIRDGYRCQLRCCAGCLILANSVDHTVRPEDGGATYDLTNLKACCKPCNTAKRNAQLAERAKQGDTFRTSQEW
jgi:5-methylcytosine-specific restriction enzyme A